MGQQETGKAGALRVGDAPLTRFIGQVDAVGKNVTHFRPGGQVFGMCRGTFAEYVCTSESPAFLSALAIKPENLTFEQAAALRVAALTALQGLRDKGKIQPGSKVLINGAALSMKTQSVLNKKRV